MPYDPDRSTDDYDSPFSGVPDAEWEAVVSGTPYPTQPADERTEDYPPRDPVDRSGLYAIGVAVVVGVLMYVLGGR